MKKITRAVAIVLLFALTIPILASCGNIASCGNMNGNKAIKKFDELIAESDKFYADGKYTESTISLEMSGTLSEVSISSKSESTGTITAINKGTESFSYLEKAQFTNSSKIGDSEETVEKFDMLKGYVDKNMIYSYVPTKKSKKVQLKSSCTPSEYEQYLDFQKGINTPQIKSEYIEEITIKEETSDNVWIITITELNKNGENAFDDWFHYSMANTSLYFKLKRFEAIITVDIDTGAIKESKMNIKAQSSVQDVEMSIKSNEKYFLPDPNENLIPENYDKYVETGNLMYSSYALHEIRKLLTLNNDTSFSFAGSTWIKSGTNLNVSENYSVNLGIKNKNFVYQIDGETRSGGKSSEMTVTYDGKNQKISYLRSF